MRAIILICLLVISIAGQSLHFIDAAAKRANTTKEKFASKICGYTTDQIAGRVFLEYGSIFVAADSVKVPNACIFRDEEAVREFQEDLRFSSARIGVAEVTLQTEAMRALLDFLDFKALIHSAIFSPKESSFSDLACRRPLRISKQGMKRQPSSPTITRRSSGS